MVDNRERTQPLGGSVPNPRMPSQPQMGWQNSIQTPPPVKNNRKRTQIFLIIGLVVFLILAVIVIWFLIPKTSNFAARIKGVWVGSVGKENIVVEFGDGSNCRFATVGEGSNGTTYNGQYSFDGDRLFVTFDNHEDLSGVDGIITYYNNTFTLSNVVITYTTGTAERIEEHKEGGLDTFEKSDQNFENTLNNFTNTYYN